MIAIGFFLVFVGALAIVLGLMMSLNLAGLMPSDEARAHTDITDTRIQRRNARFMLVGLGLVAVGFLLMWAGGA